MTIVATSRLFRRRPLSGALVLTLLAVALTGCTPAVQRLWVRNAGPTAINGLVVGFASGQVAFGDIAPGATTGYQAVPNGVLAYASYRYQMDGREISQPVEDFVGEQPLPGRDFTYNVDYDPIRFSHNRAVRALGVTTDK